MNYLSIDTGGTFIKYAYIDHSGNILGKEKVKTPYELKHFLDCLKKSSKTSRVRSTV